MPEKTVEIENCIRALEDVVADKGLLSPSMQAIMSSTVTHLQEHKKITDETWLSEAIESFMISYHKKNPDDEDWSSVEMTKYIIHGTVIPKE